MLRGFHTFTDRIPDHPGLRSGMIRVISGIIREDTGKASGVILGRCTGMSGEKMTPAQFFVPEYTDEKLSVSLLVGAVYLRVATVYIRGSPCCHRIHPGISV